MRRLWLCLAATTCCLACYEGWQPPPATAGAPPASPNPVASAVKKYAYILFQPISMSAEAVASGVCFPKLGFRTYRATEWSLRTAAISDALAAMADSYSIHPVSISAADCNQAAAIQAEALKAKPWGSDPSPEDAPSGKPLLHLKAAYWEGEPTAVPSAAVTEADWSAWRTLKSGGKPALSRHYFVIANPIEGYFTTWKKALPEAVRLEGNAADDADPTEGGQGERQSRIDTDTAALSSWLRAQAP